MKKVIFASLLTLLSLPSHASLEPIKTECSTCFSFEQFKAKAKMKAQLNKTRDVYVMNLETAKIEKFEVTKKITGYRSLPGTGGEPDGRGGKLGDRKIPVYYTMVNQKGVEQKVLNNFYDLSDAKKKLVETQKQLSGEEIPPEIAKGVWDLVGSSSTQNKVAEHYNKHASLGRDITDFVNSAAKLSGILDIDKVMMEVTFSDGSTAVYSLYAVVNGKLMWEFVRGTDVDLNTVEPNFDTSNSESYDFSRGGANAFMDFYDAATRAGVEFRSVSGSKASTGRVTCVNKGIGRYICTYTF
ncbi:hypothetical protein MHM89_11375 [Pseudoalteromonas sp. CNC9-20]|uniref:hypothetical protein n=1 Tax=Pseudoalteromonas sp. CNC9-20 TaxID=2917750 RepID=UPI001EF72FF5|nr:hypothetical protein [Pseudoalteromonas sp. CNC9-20]MCG7570533.1 hypothetical protein [Pseudoalteromonas sp. CNC9-20]